MYKHTIDDKPIPVPDDIASYYVNEPQFVDRYMFEYGDWGVENPEEETDNARIYVPIDLNRKAILRRLDEVLERYGAVSEYNECNYSTDVDMVLLQLEVYDQIWKSKHGEQFGNQRHSANAKGISLVREIVKRLEEIPNECSECFPFDTIEELKKEYLAD